MYINNAPSFTGYDARKLQGLFVTDKQCADSLRKVFNAFDVDIYTPSVASKSVRKEISGLISGNKFLWAQDYISVLKEKAILFDFTRDFLKRSLRASADGLSKVLHLLPVKSEPHLRGGNFFICNCGDKRKLIVGDNRLIYPDDLFKQIYDVDEVCPIPRADYHLDLFLRPLDSGNVLVADNNMTMQGLKQGLLKLKNYLANGNLTDAEKTQIKSVIEQLELNINMFEITKEFSPKGGNVSFDAFGKTGEICNKLQEYGFNPIRVPATFYKFKAVKDADKEQEMMNNFKNNMNHLRELCKNESAKVRFLAENYIAAQSMKAEMDKTLGVTLENFYINNFINAIVTKNKDGELMYVTNASLLDKNIGITPEIEEKTGFSTKKMFIDSVKSYIKPENIFFIDEKLTDKLFNFMGGIHCTAAEIPV